MMYFLEGKKDWEITKRPEYMNKLNRKEVGTIFRARTRMLDIKENYPGKYQNNICRICNSEGESQSHILEKCEGMNREFSPITKEMIFDEIFF